MSVSFLGDHALPSIASSPLAEELPDLLARMGWSQRALAQHLGVSAQSVSRWARGTTPINERDKAAIRFTVAAAELYYETLIGAPPEGPLNRDPDGRPVPVGDHLRGVDLSSLIALRMQRDRWDFYPDPDVRPLDAPAPPLGRLKAKDTLREASTFEPIEVFQLRDALGWTQAEMAAFFGVTPSTPSVWEKPDPGLSTVTQAELFALRLWAQRTAASAKDAPTKDRSTKKRSTAKPSSTGSYEPPGEVRTLWQQGVSHFLAGMIGRGESPMPSTP